MRSLLSPVPSGWALLLSLPGLAVVFSACTQISKGDESEGETPGIVVNQKPIANAGGDATQTADTAAGLSGAASSDPDGNVPMLWHWSFDHLPAGSALASLEAPFANNHTAAGITSSFTPDVAGTYVVKLVVTDSKGLDSDPDFVIITIESPDAIPVANAGVDVTMELGPTVSLNGSSSFDPLGRTLTYAWTLLDKPSDSHVTTLTDATAATASFTPDVKGVYVASLVVDNGLAPSNADAVTITVTQAGSSPTANAGNDQLREDCTNIQLDCSRSADPDGDPLSYMWELQSKPTGSAISNASLSSRTVADPTFYPDIAGVYVFSCAVSDGESWSAPDSVSVVTNERGTNTRPVAEAGANLTVSGGTVACELDGYTYDCDECADQTLTLGSDAIATDPDGDPITHQWTVVSGDATISDSGSVTTTVTLADAAPTDAGECTDTDYEFQLTVTDCTGVTSTDTVKFTVNCCGEADTSAVR